MQKPITIIGGGLAGLTLGICLRRSAVPVRVIEAGKYPRHRVCGEFISGRGQDVLKEIGLLEDFLAEGAIYARTANFYSERNLLGRYNLPEPALCLSRYRMDALLARRFRDAGGELREGDRWSGQAFMEGIVRATGRRIEAVVDGWRFFGLKVHAKKVSPEADLEIHLRDNGYIGLCKLADDEVNICGLFRTRTVHPQLALDWKSFLIGDPQSQIAMRLESAEFNEGSFCSIAGLSLRRQDPTRLPEWSIGDSISMIAPLTGNGMSLAFESAAVSTPALVEFSRGRIAWDDAQKGAAIFSQKVFGERLRWAALLQSVFMSASGQKVAGNVVSCCPPLWKFLFAKTR